MSNNVQMALMPENERIRRDDFFLVQRALCGEQAAYTEIYNRYINRLTRQVRGIVGREDAEDVAHRVIERAFERLKEFQPERHLGAWLGRMANNLAIDYVRANRRRKATSIDEENEEEDSRPLQVPDPDPLPEDTVIEGETREQVRRVVSQMSPTHELVLRLKYVNNMSVEEVADATGYSPDAVRRCLHAIRRTLKARITL